MNRSPSQHPEAVRGRKRYAANPEASHQRVLRWRNAHPDKLRVIAQKSNHLRYLKVRAVIDAAKSGPCADCGKNYPPYVMDFDHRDPAEKSYGLARMAMMAIPRILAEIAKCDAVCANCHRERTHNRLNDYPGAR